MLGSLDFVHVPTAEVDLAARASVEDLEAELAWKVRGMGQRFAVYELVRPGAAASFEGRIGP